MTDISTLRRSLGLPLITLYGLGNILGAGIYVLIGKVAGEAGYFSPFSFLIASIIAGITAFSFADLSARYPISAGTAVYIKEGFRAPKFSLVVGLLVILTGIVSAATMAKGFAGYLSVFIVLNPELVILGLLSSLALVAIWGVAESVSVAATFTVLEVAGLLLIIFVTMPALSELPAWKAELTPNLDSTAWFAMFGGAFIAFYAYVGFEDMVNLAEEVKNSTRNLPIAILLSLGLATLIYMLIALNSLLILSPTTLAESSAPLADVYRAATARDPWFISVVSLFAVINGALIQIIMGSRVSYGLAKQGLLPAVLGRINPRTKTPILATTIIAALVAFVALWLPLESLAKSTSYLLLVLFFLVNLSLIRIKRRKDAAPSPFSIPTSLPYFGCLSCVLFLVLQTWAFLNSLI